MNRFLLTYFLLIFSFSTFGQAEEIISTVLNASEHLEKIIDVDSLERQEAEWEETYRTSDEEGEKRTQYEFDVNHPPADAKRVGCICMDGTSMDLRGGGACAGYAGVRFWIYELKNGDEYLHPTERHKFHPSPLTEEEIANLGSRTKQMKYGNAYKGGSNGLGWEELMAILAICVTIAFITKTLWGNRNNKNDELYS